MTTISPLDLFRKCCSAQFPCLLDVRSPREFAQVHVPGAVLMPLDKLDPAEITGRWAKSDQPLFLLCHSGGRARKAAEQLERSGRKNCIIVTGGTQAWLDAGLPVERQKVRGISIERQVRIVAGALVFVGTLLGAFCHAAFLVLPGIVGAGLVFAGLSDICGMGVLLARAPWNQASNGSCGPMN